MRFRFRRRSQFLGQIGKSLLEMVIACIPLLGQLRLTFLIVQEKRGEWSQGLWLIAVWLLPYGGPLAYLLLGRTGRRGEAWISLLVLIAAFVVFLLVYAGWTRLLR
jgi:Phospholipase_D-nuclease N-terminal